MTKDSNIIVPRWFLENVENTLRIQNNINLNKKTGETCQDRNVRESLNGLRKLLKGEEVTGMERLEKLQPSISSNLDEAAEEFAFTNWEDNDYHKGASEGVPFDPIGYTEKVFKAGAKWVVSQGETVSGIITKVGDKLDVVTTEYLSEESEFERNDRVTVQIRKE